MEKEEGFMEKEEVKRVLTTRFLILLISLTILWAVVGTAIAVSITAFAVSFSFGSAFNFGVAIGPLILLSLISLLRGPLRTLRVDGRQLAVLYACIATASLVSSTHFPVIFYGSQMLIRLEAWWRVRLDPHYPLFWLPSLEFLDPIKFGGVAVPWGVWAAPIVFWFLLLFVAQYLFVSSIVFLIRRRWIDEERLVFPVGTIAATMIKGSLTKTPPEEKASTRVMYISMALGFIVNMPWILKVVFPWLPSLYGWDKPPWWPWQPGTLDLAYGVPIGRMLAGCFAFNFNPLALAIGYLAPLDMLWTILVAWLIFFVIWPQIGFAMGYYPAALPEYPSGWRLAIFGGKPPIRLWAFTDAGFLIGYVIFLFILFGRKYIAELARSIRKGPTPEEVGREPIPYRWAFMVFIGSMVMLAAMIVGSGAEAWSATLVIILTLLWCIGWSRIRGEYGMMPVTHHLAPGYLFNFKPYFGIVTWPAITRDFVVTAQMSNTLLGGLPAYSFTNQALAFNIFDSYKVASVTGARNRDIFIANTIGFLLAGLVSTIVFLWISYTYGFFKLPIYVKQKADLGWPMRTPLSPVWVAARIDPPIYPELLAGVLLAAVLLFLRMRFIWWPINPIGFVVGAGQTAVAHGAAGVALVALPLKLLTIKVGGARLYERYGAPIASGVACGTALAMFVGMLMLAWLAFIPA